MNPKTETKTVLEVYDPAMCCSTGVCGSDVDDTLADFANDVKWLKAQGIEVNRFNLGQEPEAFKMKPEVLTRLQKTGTECLPIIFVNDTVVAEGGYPDRGQIINLLGLETTKQPTSATENNQTDKPQNIMTEQVEELVALGAALASNCESCLKFHFKKAKDLGLTEEDIAQALQIGQNVKQVPSGNMIQLANKLLGVQQTPANGCAPGSGCC